MSPPNCCYCFICKKSLSFADGIHFFIFPWKHPQKLQKWFTNLGLADKPNSLQPTLRSHICSLHFRPDDLKRCGKRVRLLPHAIPQPVNNQVKSRISADSKVVRPLSDGEVTRLRPRAPNDLPSVRPLTKASNYHSLGSFSPGCDLSLTRKALVQSTEMVRDVQQSAFTTNGTTETAKVPQPTARASQESHSAEPMHITVEIDPFDLGEDSGNADSLSNSDAESAENEQKPRKPIVRQDSSRLYPASCAPEDSDSPCKMKKKIAVLYSAYQSLKKRNKTALQSIRRLKKENSTLKSMLQDFRKKEKSRSSR